MTVKPNKTDPVALRKQLIQMRLELSRQKIRHEALILIEPVEKIRNYKKRFTQGAHPLLLVAGITLASLFITRNRNLASSLPSVVGIVSSLLPLFLRPGQETDKVTAGTDNLKKPQKL